MFKYDEAFLILAEVAGSAELFIFDFISLQTQRETICNRIYEIQY